MRIAIAKFGQETSSFSPVPTTLDSFKLFGLYEGQDVLAKAQGVGATGGFLAETEGLDWTPIPLFSGWAGASGIITAETLKFFEERLIEGLQAAKPVDAFFFDLHGAGQSENEPDTEGHLLAISREILGDDVPIVISLDHHANLTQQMIDNADSMVGHRTQPHDPFDTGKLAARLLMAQLREGAQTDDGLAQNPDDYPPGTVPDQPGTDESVVRPRPRDGDSPRRTLRLDLPHAALAGCARRGLGSSGCDQ